MIFTYLLIPGRVDQPVTTDVCLTADQGGSEFEPGPVPYFFHVLLDAVKERSKTQ